jgi:hypothetical protein
MTQNDVTAKAKTHNLNMPEVFNLPDILPQKHHKFKQKKERDIAALWILLPPQLKTQNRISAVALAKVD